MKQNANSPVPFLPFEQFRGLFVPNWLSRQRTVSQGAKLCYGRLMQFQGRGRQCNPRESLLALELGVSERTCRRFLAELKKHGLITIHQRGLRRSNSYGFLRHAWMSDFRADDSDRSQRPSSSAPDRTEMSAPLVRDSEEGESKEENNPCSPLSGDGECSTKNLLDLQVEEIYAAYPKPMGKPSALRAIRRAIRKFGFPHVLKRTTEYAANPPEHEYIPAPHKFFRDERFNDALPSKENRKRFPQGVQVTNPAAYPGGKVQL